MLFRESKAHFWTPTGQAARGDFSVVGLTDDSAGLKAKVERQGRGRPGRPGA